MLDDSPFGGNGVDETFNIYRSRKAVCSQCVGPLDEEFGQVNLSSMAIRLPLYRPKSRLEYHGLGRKGKRKALKKGSSFAALALSNIR